MNLNGARVVVTGAGGFIGSHLTERLVELGAEVRAFVHYNSSGTAGWLEHSDVKGDVDILVGDLADAGTLAPAMTGIDIVFHLGALIAIPYSYIAPASYVQSNVVGTTNVLLAARAAGVVRVVHTSTSEVYGTAEQVPMTESHRLSAQSPYAASKTGADQMALAFARSFAMSVVTIRPFNTFGPRQSARAVIPTLISQSLFSDTLYVGNLSPTRDFTFVSDTVEGFIRAAEVDNLACEVINLGSGFEISIADLARLIGELCDRDMTPHQEEVRMRAAGTEVERLCCDNSKAAELLGWKPTLSLEEGLGRTIAWVREHPEYFPVESYSI